jgi:hypothetical protein
MTTNAEHIVFEQIQFAAVTRNGFSDVSILTAGEADGHGMIVDEKTIAGFMELAMGKTIPAYLTHDGAIDDSGRPADRLGKEIGMFSGFYRDGDKVRARNFQFLDSFIASEPKTHSTLVEMAQKFADKLGISPVIAHFKAWVLGDGTEVPAKNGPRPENASFAMPSMRVAAIKSCDFVQQPAANVGLFHAKVDDQPNIKSTMSADTILLSKHNEALTAKDGEIAALSQQHKDAVAALEKKHGSEISALQAKLNEAVAQSAKTSEESKALTAALAAKTKEAEDAAKYDMRKVGAPALEVALAAVKSPLPAPANTDAGKWDQYAALCEIVKDEKTGVVLAHKETKIAAEFKAKYLARK